MEGFNGFLLIKENGQKLKLVTDFILGKKEYYLFEDGNYYYEENGKAVMLDKESKDGKVIVEKILDQIKSPVMDVIGLDEKRKESKRIIVDKYKPN
ncbi:MAG: hypothetical protein IKJ36_03240 [Clostridia bacterium]|nr:hypothetical protein [Clostridia bacterium]